MRATHRDVIVPSPRPEGLRRASAEQSGLRRVPPPPQRRDTMPSLWREVTAGAPFEDPDPTYTPAPLPRTESERINLDALVETLSAAPPPPLVVPPVALPAKRRSTSALPWVLAAGALAVAAFLAGLLAADRGADAPASPVHEAAPASSPASRVVTLEPVVFQAAQPEPEAVVPKRSPAARPRSARPTRSIPAPVSPTSAPASVISAPEGVAADAPALVETPGRADVRAALDSIRADVEACAQPADTGRLAHVRVTFGSDGRALHAVVDGVSGATASCIARAARGAHVPPFAREHFAVAAPFTL